MKSVLLPVVFGWFAAILATNVIAQDNAVAADEISEITVEARRVANARPAGTYASPATELRFDPLTELQSRGLAEGQSDITVRGGLFENTGFALGPVTVMDPQTGHYVAELPVDPRMMTTPAIYSSVDNALAGFNSAVATVSYGYERIESGGHVDVGFGSDSLNFQSLSISGVANGASKADFGASFSFARSEGDGSVENGDHSFERYNLHLQRDTDSTESNLIVAYQEKFYGWPGAYTGFATLAETDDTETTLLIGNHRVQTANGWFELGGFYRRLVDDYDFNRTTDECCAPGSFDHETKIYALGFQGLHRSGRIDWRYGGQVTSDELVRSTDLTNGSFDERCYGTLTILPSTEFGLENGNTFRLAGGATLDESSRDSSKVSPLLRASLVRSSTNGETVYSLEYAETSQLPGYTVLKSNPTGLFGGNASLGRERAKQFMVSAKHDAGDWQGRIAAFYRNDIDLVDWTFASGAPFARQANPVDIDVTGLEAFFVRQWASIDVSAGLTFLDKDADYGSAQVDASYYALNFAKYRATLAMRYRIGNQFELRLDNEYRLQEDNPLRTSSDSTYLGAVSLTWTAEGVGGFAAALVVDNVTDSDYQPFPGTPAAGRQLSLSASYTW